MKARIVRRCRLSNVSGARAEMITCSLTLIVDGEIVKLEKTTCEVLFVLDGDGESATTGGGDVAADGVPEVRATAPGSAILTQIARQIIHICLMVYDIIAGNS